MSGSSHYRQANFTLFHTTQRIEADRDKVVYTPTDGAVGPLLTAESSKAFISLLYLLSPVQPQRTIHNLTRNLCLCEQSRSFLLHTLVGLLNNDNPRVLHLIKSLDKDSKDDKTDLTSSLTFPPTSLIGVPPVPIQDRNPHSRHPTCLGGDQLAALLLLLPLVCQLALVVRLIMTRSLPLWLGV